MDDHCEGCGESKILGDLNNASWTDPFGNQFNSITTSAGGPVSYGLGANASLFCASIGPYSADRHRAIVSGHGAYKPNCENVAWVEVEAKRLLKAVQLLGQAAYPEWAQVELRAVQYGTRTYLDGPEAIAKALSGDTHRRRTLEVAFTKPLHFRVEEEARFAVFSQREARVLFTRDFSPEIVEAFRSAIHDPGDCYPRTPTGK